MKSYVYEILHKPTNSVYVGSRRSEELETIEKYSGSSSSELFSKESIRNNPNDYQKTIFKTFDTEIGAYEYENGDNGMISRYIDEYGNKCFNKYYISDNKKPFSKIGKKHSNKTKERISKSNKGENNGMYGKKHLEKSLKKMSEIKIGENNAMYKKTRSNEIKEKISQSIKGNTNTKGKIYIHKHENCVLKRKMINSSDLQEYLDNGWNKGMGKK